MFSSPGPDWIPSCSQFGGIDSSWDGFSVTQLNGFPRDLNQYKSSIGDKSKLWILFAVISKNLILGLAEKSICVRRLSLIATLSNIGLVDKSNEEIKLKFIDATLSEELTGSISSLSLDLNMLFAIN